MKKIFFILIILITTVLPSMAATGTNPQPWEYFPDFSGVTVDGYPVNLRDYLGGDRYVLIDFWATTCKPCLDEMPNVLNAWSKYGPDKLFVIGVNCDYADAIQDVKDYMSYVNMTFPVINDFTGFTNSLGTQCDIEYIPQNFLLAPDGVILYKDLREGDLEGVMGNLLEFGDPRNPVNIDLTVLNDPRSDPGFRTTTELTTEQLTSIVPLPLNEPPNDLKLNLYVYNRERDDFDAVLKYWVIYPTGSWTNMYADRSTGDVIRSKDNGSPLVYWEIKITGDEKSLKGKDGKLFADLAIPLGPAAYGVMWQFSVFSPALGRDVVEGPEFIDFSGLNIIPEADVQAMGGVLHYE